MARWKIERQEQNAFHGETLNKRIQAPSAMIRHTAEL
jgi:hypothetical protein